MLYYTQHVNPQRRPHRMKKQKKLTLELLNLYTKGQLHITDTSNQQVFRGQIMSIRLTKVGVVFTSMQV